MSAKDDIRTVALAIFGTEHSAADLSWHAVAEFTRQDNGGGCDDHGSAEVVAVAPAVTEEEHAFRPWLASGRARRLPTLA
jgi:hypothetical protein